VAPGTWGSLASLPVAWLIASIGGWPALAVGSAVVFVVGCWAAGRAAAIAGVEDPGSIVIDEVAGQWLVLLFTPPNLFLYGAGFLLFRLFDITKPWPAGWADRHVKGGFGVMLDDLLAAIYGLGVMSLVQWLWGGR
jgi:phosphatidylglycerophosphatase A